MQTTELCDQRVEVSLEQGIGEILFNDPNNLNVFDDKSCEAFAEAATWLSLQLNVRVVLLKAKGRAFSVGGNILAFKAAGEASDHLLKIMTTHFHTAVACLAHMDAPVISVVNGICGGAGASLVCASDMVIASEHTKITFAYTALAISPDGGATYYLPRIVGERKAYELLTQNPTLTAHEAEKIGLVNRVVSAEDLEEQALKLAKNIALGPTKAFGAVKQLLLKSYTQSLESQLVDEGKSIAELSITKDGKEGISAFLEKRDPNFSGE